MFEASLYRVYSKILDESESFKPTLTISLTQKTLY